MRAMHSEGSSRRDQEQDVFHARSMFDSSIKQVLLPAASEMYRTYRVGRPPPPFLCRHRHFRPNEFGIRNVPASSGERFISSVCGVAYVFPFWKSMRHDANHGLPSNLLAQLFQTHQDDLDAVDFAFVLVCHSTTGQLKPAYEDVPDLLR